MVGLGLLTVTRPVLTGSGPDRFATGLDQSFCLGFAEIYMYFNYLLEGPRVLLIHVVKKKLFRLVMAEATVMVLLDELAGVHHR